jgi:hypothetical protein
MGKAYTKGHEKVRHIPFVGAVVAIICFLWWLFTTVIR